MQYLVTVIEEFLPGGVRADESGSATPDEDGAIAEFNRRLKADGHWVFVGGLASPSTATVVDNRGEEPMITDGPFLESKEHLAGIWVIEAADLDAALKIAVEASKACNRKVEVRPFL
ncbi:hypothetical protein FB566_1773 [Stackebrandtia endophytica]|uniref:YCII-related domain-containing protein n=1 Tax=Stackebrandtia endophytica TaxID=1496996 RepID=A0A543AUL0_9ACTN|nr:hypothetical protein FB566_1773 [Stackebrandtia endophytica]